MVQEPTEKTRPADRRPAGAACAVVWINGRQAIVARLDREAGITTSTIERGCEPEWSYLGHVIEAIGDRERVVILGPGSARLALEREYVSIYPRPERLVDVEPSGLAETTDLVERLRQLAA